MVEACGDWPEPDLVLAVSPPVPRRRLGALIQRPWSTPSAAVAAPTPPPVPPPVPAATAPETVTAPVVEPEDGVSPGAWPDRRWWASTGASTVVHVVLLTILALLVTRPDERLRLRPIEISRPSEEPEPTPFPDPEEQFAVQVLEPVAEPVVDELVEKAVVVEEDATDVTAAAFEAGDDAVDGVIELDPAGMMAKVGGGTGGGAGGGQGGGGFGGEIGRRLARAGARTGDVQVSLSWENFNDIDLHVITPAGERIFFAHRRSACRGRLDVDMNAQGPMTREPVENVFWPKGSAPTGEYQVFVHHFAKWDPKADETAFDVHVLVNGVRRRFTGYVRSGEPPVAVTRFVKDAGGSASDEFVE